MMLVEVIEQAGNAPLRIAEEVRRFEGSKADDNGRWMDHDVRHVRWTVVDVTLPN